MSNSETKEFGKIRNFLWPIHGFEMKKFFPMFMMFFFISFNYTILRDTKDTLVVTAAGSGAETIAFIKFWGVIPCAILFTLIYAKLSNILSRENLFYVAIAPFIIFFALFATVLYPLKDVLHPTTSADALQSFLPEGFMGLIAIYRNWTFSLFYIMAELWGSVALSLLFWSFANEVTKIAEAKRFYNRLGIGANVALLFSGPAIVWSCNIRNSLPADVDAWGVSLNYLMAMVVTAGIAVMAIYWWMNRNVLNDKRFYDPSEGGKKKKKKPQMSIKDSFLYLMKSPYIGCIALLVIAYGISINLVEVTWKGQLKAQYPNPNDYNTFMGYFSTWMGGVTIVMMLFIGPWLIHKSWGLAAAVTPVMIMLTGVAFFSFIIFRDSLTPLMAALHTTPLMAAVLFGAAQNVMSKSAKYSLFDPTKEIAYIPLDQESKVKGKAAIDVVGARLGKSGGALINQGLIIGFGSLAAITPYVAVITCLIVGVWLVAVKALNRRFLDLTEEKAHEEAEAPAAKPATEAKPATTTA